MQKRNKIAEKTVGADASVCPNSKGITLIALIITIIVMIILVGVTVNVALNGGLFNTTEQATKETQIEADREILQVGLAGAMVGDTGITKESLQKNLPEGWNVEGAGPFTVTSPNGNEFTVNADGTIKEPIELPEGWNQEAISEVIVETIDGEEYKVPIPKGYVASKATGENTVAQGLVIYEGTEEVNDSNIETARTTRNQFVWIPVTEDFTETYSSEGNYSEPREITSLNYPAGGVPYDSQGSLDYFYGEGYFDYPETEEEKENVENDFAYVAHYKEIVNSINKYKGFYIGRYETTIDENNEVGSKYDATVLTSDKTIEQTNNKICRWYGLYYTQRNSNVHGNNDYIQTNMICGQEWDAMINYFDSRSIDYSEWGESTQGKVVNSGQSTNESTSKDEIYNIFDLRTNAREWTAEARLNNNRSCNGGYYGYNYSASNRGTYYSPSSSYNGTSSRLILYIK